MVHRVGDEVIFSMRHNTRHWTKATIVGFPSASMALIEFKDGVQWLVPRKTLR